MPVDVVGDPKNINALDVVINPQEKGYLDPREYIDDELWNKVKEQVRSSGVFIDPTGYNLRYCLLQLFPERSGEIVIGDDDINNSIEEIKKFDNWNSTSGFDNYLFDQAYLILNRPETRSLLSSFINPNNYKEVEENISNYKIIKDWSNYIPTVQNTVVCYPDKFNELTSLDEAQQKSLIEFVESKAKNDNDFSYAVDLLKINPNLISDSFRKIIFEKAKKAFISNYDYLKSKDATTPPMSLTYLGFSAYRLLVIQADRITLDELGWHLEFGEKPESQ